MIRHYTPENESIVRAAFLYGDNINGWLIANYSPHCLRYIERDGRLILQQELYVKVTYEKPIWKFGDFTREDAAYVWFDVPTDDGAIAELERMDDGQP